MATPIKPAIRKLTDWSLGHLGFPSSYPIQGSSRTFADGLSIVRRWDKYSPHTQCWEDEGGLSDANDATFGGTGDGWGTDMPFQNGPPDDESKAEGSLTRTGVIVDKVDRGAKNFVVTLENTTGTILTNFEDNDDQEFSTDTVPVGTLDTWGPGLISQTQTATIIHTPFSGDTFPEGITEANGVIAVDGAGNYSRLEYITTKPVVDEDLIEFFMFFAKSDIFPGGSLGSTCKFYVTHSENGFVTAANSLGHFTIGRNADGSILTTANAGAQNPENFTNVVAIDAGPSFSNDSDPASNWIKFALQVRKAAGTAPAPEGATIKIVMGPPAIGASVYGAAPSMVVTPGVDPGEGDDEGDGDGGGDGEGDPEGPTVDPDPPTVIVYGCTDENAINYNPDATVNDGTCIFAPDPQDDSDDLKDVSEQEPDVILGCTNNRAINYNPDATVDDGSCIFEEEPLTPFDTAFTRNVPIDPDYLPLPPHILSLGDIFDIPIDPDYDPVVGTGAATLGDTLPVPTDNQGKFSDVDGDAVPDSYSGFIDVPIDPDFTPISPDVKTVGDVLDLPFDPDYNPADPRDKKLGDLLEIPPDPDPRTADPIKGCTNPNAINYNPYAGEDDGSCYYSPFGQVPGIEGESPLAGGGWSTIPIDPDALPISADVKTVGNVLDLPIHPDFTDVGGGTTVGDVRHTIHTVPTDGDVTEADGTTVGDADARSIPIDPDFLPIDPNIKTVGGVLDIPTASSLPGIEGESRPTVGGVLDLPLDPDLHSGSTELIVGCMNPDAANYNADATVSDPSLCIFFPPPVTTLDTDFDVRSIPIDPTYFPLDSATTKTLADVYDIPIDPEWTEAEGGFITSGGGVTDIPPPPPGVSEADRITSLTVGDVIVFGGGNDPDSRVGDIEIVPTGGGFTDVGGTTTVGSSDSIGDIPVGPDFSDVGSGATISGGTATSTDTTGGITSIDRVDQGVTVGDLFSIPTHPDWSDVDASSLGGGDVTEIDPPPPDFSSLDRVSLPTFGDIVELPPVPVPFPGGLFEIIYGCTDENAINTDEDATVDDGSCEYVTIITGEPPPGITITPTPIPPDFTVITGEPKPDLDPPTQQIPGCMDPNAINYNPNATVDDGSCLYPGCTDPEAENFDEDANIDDGSCLYEGDESGGPQEDENEEGFCITHNPYALLGAPRVFVELKQLHRGVAHIPPGPAGDPLSCGDLAGYSPSRVLVGT